MAQSDEPPYEQFVELFARSESDLRKFVRSLLPTWHDADEVVQQVALVAWRKFEQFDPATRFSRWLCVIARFEVMTYRRKMARDRLVLSEDLLQTLADEALEEIEERQEETDALETCLRQLPDEQRRFVTLAYSSGVSIQDLAEQAGVRPGTFYMRLNRIRKTLLGCIQGTLKRREA